MAICVYCDQNRKLTREHVWSSTILRLFDSVAPRTFDEAHARVYDADPVVRDLCQECNGALSPADTAMGAFAGRHLISPIGDRVVVHFDHLDVLRWVMKTVSNHERVLKLGTSWWKPFVPFFKGGEGETRRVDLFLAPWRDLSPEQMASATNMVLTLGAASANFSRLRDVDAQLVHQQLDTCWSLKIGYGVFLLVVWKPVAPTDLIGRVANELRRYGWLRRGEDSCVSRIPFNAFTCVTYSIPTDPLDMEFFQTLAAQRSCVASGDEETAPWGEPPQGE